MVLGIALGCGCKAESSFKFLWVDSRNVILRCLVWQRLEVRASSAEFGSTTTATSRLHPHIYFAPDSVSWFRHVCNSLNPAVYCCSPYWREMDSGNPQAESSTSSTLMDTASSLRAAALLSRKRRKVATESLPRRLEPSFQLDYGQEDSMPASPPSTHTKTPFPPQPGRSDPSTVDQSSSMEHGQREEGEISDNETSPAPQFQRTPTPPARTSPRTPTTQLHHTDRGKNDTGPLPPSPHCETDPPSPSEPTNRLWSAGIRPSNEHFLSGPSTYRLDASHVRPGLTSWC